MYKVRVEERCRDGSPVATAYEWDFSTEAEAQKFFDEHVRSYMYGCYQYLTDQEKKHQFFEATLYDTEDKGCFCKDYMSVGINYGWEKNMYLFKTEGGYLLEMIENIKGVITRKVYEKEPLPLSTNIEDIDDDIDKQDFGYGWSEHRLYDQEYEAYINNAKSAQQKGCYCVYKTKVMGS